MPPCTWRGCRCHCLWWLDQKACCSIMNTQVGTLACKILDVIVTQSPADPTKPTPPQSPSIFCLDVATARGSSTPVWKGNVSSGSLGSSTLCFVVVVHVCLFGVFVYYFLIIIIYFGLGFLNNFLKYRHFSCRWFLWNDCNGKKRKAMGKR